MLVEPVVARQSMDIIGAEIKLFHTYDATREFRHDRGKTTARIDAKRGMQEQAPESK